MVAQRFDGVLQLDTAPVHLVARPAEGLGHVLRGDRAEEAAVLTRAVGDREHRLAEQRGEPAGKVAQQSLSLRGSGRSSDRRDGSADDVLAFARRLPLPPADPNAATDAACLP